MKIAQICPRFPPHIGGIETHVYEISKRLAKEFDVEILTTDPRGALADVECIGDVAVRRFRSFAPSNSYYLSLDLYKYLKGKSDEYDILHAHSYHALPALHAAMAKGENPILVFTPHYHGKGHSFIRNLLHKPYKLLGREIFSKANAVICVSEYEKDLVLRDFNVDKTRIHVIPNGVNLDEFRCVRVNECKDVDEKIILYVGRLEKYKGVDYVVRALPRLSSEFVLNVVGDGSYKQNIVKLARKLGVMHRIRFYQKLNREKLIEMYSKANVLVLLSKYEAYGLAVAEALAAGTPCVVANEAALKEWVDDRSVFGVDYPVDVDELAKLIKNVAGKRVVKNDRLDKLMDWNDVAIRIKRVYLSVIW